MLTKLIIGLIANALLFFSGLILLAAPRGRSGSEAYFGRRGLSSDPVLAIITVCVISYELIH